jgi:hypothetical protein
MLRTSVILLTLGLVSASLSSCCDCDSDRFATLTLRFNPDSLGGPGFRRAEVGSAYVVRYAATLSSPIDTLRQRPAGSNSAPEAEFLALDRQSFNLYLPINTRAGQAVSSYRLVVPAATRRYDLTDLDVKTSTSKGPCSCSGIDRLDFSLNGQRQDGRNTVEMSK